MRFLMNVELIREKLVKKSLLSRNIMSTSLRKVHEVIRLKLNHLKANGLRSWMNERFYDLEPRNREQLKILPSIQISVSGLYLVTHHFKL